jgi:lysyl-tRNA synthetase class 2
LQKRALVLAQIRSFFAKRGVLEVETPLLCPSCAPEAMIEPFYTEYHGPNPCRLYLQASPELAMKRLLAAGSGPIFQLSRAFRDGEAGRLHNPEFTLLEWYRPAYDHHALMDEVDQLLQEILGTLQAERLTYQQVFLSETDLDPLDSPLPQVREYAAQWGLDTAELDRDTCLQLILTHQIEPTLGQGCPTFIYDYPASQAALARRNPDNPAVAERFEVYVRGVELANGFHELADPVEQRQRFEAELTQRRALGLVTPPLDENFFAALESGLPDCSGVALGVDRLAMLAAGASSLAEIMAFPLDRI